MKKKNIIFTALIIISLIGFLIAPYLIFVLAPVEPVQGFVQKIFYYHVPCAWSMFLGGILSGIGGGMYLFSRGEKGAGLTLAGAELSVTFGILVMTTGPLWAKIAWGHYWVWDVRLTTSALVFLTFIAVLVARKYSGSAGRKVAAGLALFGAVNIPFVYISVKVWNTIHPKTSVVPTLTGNMKLAFFISLASFTLLTIILLWLRLGVESLKEKLDQTILELQEAEDSQGVAP